MQNRPKPLNQVISVTLQFKLTTLLAHYSCLSGPSGMDVMISSRRGGSGFDDYYTLTYDEMDEQYEEDSIPGMGSGGSGSPSTMAFLSGNKLPPGKETQFMLH